MENGAVPTLDLKSFDIDQKNGFLPAKVPLLRVPFLSTRLYAYAYDTQRWEEFGLSLPKLIAARAVKEALKSLPAFPMTVLTQNHKGNADVLMRLFSFIGHAYIWENWEIHPETIIPAKIALPWYEISKQLGRPPVLSYKSYALDNWQLIDPKGPIELGNTCLLQNFLGGLDEEWFILPHVEIEAEAAPAICAIGKAQLAVLDNDSSELEKQLGIMAQAQENMYQTLCRIPEYCDPYIYYNRVRPYIHGFDKYPVVYEGVAEYNGKPQYFFGETGAQSSIVPSLDAAFGITHQQDKFTDYLDKMSNYMPPKHRAYIQAVKDGSSIRDFVYSNFRDSLREVFEKCVQLLNQFRLKHIEYASTYIHKQSQKSRHNPTDHGTGGTPFMPYLKKHWEETK